MTFQSLVTVILQLFSYLITLIIGAGLVIFLYGIFTYLTNYSDEKKREESIKYIIYGLLGLFVMISVWGLVGLITGSFGLEKAIPQIRI